MWTNIFSTFGTRVKLHQLKFLKAIFLTGTRTTNWFHRQTPKDVDVTNIYSHVRYTITSM